MSGDHALGNSGPISQDTAKQTLKHILYTVVHTHKAMSLTQIALASGVGYDTISTYMAGTNEPSFSKAMSILSVLPTWCMNYALDPVGFVAHRREGRPIAAIAADMEALIAELRGAE